MPTDDPILGVIVIGRTTYAWTWTIWAEDTEDILRKAMKEYSDPVQAAKDADAAYREMLDEYHKRHLPFESITFLGE